MADGSSACLPHRPACGTRRVVSPRRAGTANWLSVVLLCESSVRFAVAFVRVLTKAMSLAPPAKDGPVDLSLPTHALEGALTAALSPPSPLIVDQVGAGTASRAPRADCPLVRAHRCLRLRACTWSPRSWSAWPRHSQAGAARAVAGDSLPTNRAAAARRAGRRRA
jgi:hypothetical protein